MILCHHISPTKSHHHIKMCIGRPLYHACCHSSVDWLKFCPGARVNPSTGCQLACRKPTFMDSQTTNEACPLQTCRFVEKGGSWACCQCFKGPNYQGWCAMPADRQVQNRKTGAWEWVKTTCDHGCCENCTSMGKLQKFTYLCTRKAADLYRRWRRGLSC